MSILEKINGHEDLQQLSDKERTQLCREIREFLKQTVTRENCGLSVINPISKEAAV